MIFQSTFPSVSFTHYKAKSPYFTFKAGGTAISSENLQSYSYQRSVNTFSGSFSITYKEDITKKETFLDMLEPMDIVKIYEKGNSELSFIGVVMDISYTSSTQGFQRLITITGKSIEYLFEMLNISLDITAMLITDSAVQKEIANIQATTSANDGKAVKVESALNSLYNSFKNIANKNDKISNVAIIDIIEKIYSSGKFDIPKSLSFKLPIVSNMFSGDVANYISYVQNFFPNNVYEFYGTFKDGNPKIKVREKPFSPSDWKSLKITKIHPELFTNYTITRSMDEVYTYFYSYIEGSALSSEFYARAGASGDVVAYDDEKRKIYGYKPLRCNFVGYNPNGAEDNSEFKKIFKELSSKMKTWYSKLDEMWNGTFTCVIAKDIPTASIGERIEVLSGQFYVSGEDHQWHYGSSPKITYHCERGGKYSSDGKFSKLTGISKVLSDFEFENVNGGVKR